MLKLKNSSYTFEVEEKDDKEAMLKAITLANPRLFCGVCRDLGLENKTLEARKSKSDKGTFIYISVRCNGLEGKCGSRSTLGTYQDGGYFWKEYERFEGKQQTTTARPQAPVEDVSPDEIPF